MDAMRAVIDPIPPSASEHQRGHSRSSSPAPHTRDGGGDKAHEWICGGKTWRGWNKVFSFCSLHLSKALLAKIKIPLSALWYLGQRAVFLSHEVAVSEGAVTVAAAMGIRGGEAQGPQVAPSLCSCGPL